MIRNNIFHGVINHADVSKWYSLHKSVPTFVVISLNVPGVAPQGHLEGLEAPESGLLA